jgi:DNA modification methylase
MTITTHHGDCAALLPTLPPRSVQCCVTSPPYFGLRRYAGVTATAWPEIEYTPMPGLPPVVIPAMVCCLGDESDPLAYVGHLVHVFRLVWRVLRNDGTLWLNLGDSYAGNRSYQVSPTKWKSLEFGGSNACKVPDGCKQKDLLLIPSRVALALQADGWLLRNDVIWHKPNPMPASVQDRLTVSHEHIFLLAKQQRYYYDQQAIAEPSVSDHGSGNGFKRPARLVAGGRGNDEPWEPQPTRNARDVWSIPTRPYSGAHFAVFPEELPRRCILAGSSPQACEQCGAPWKRVMGDATLNPDRPQARRAQALWQERGLTDAHLQAIRAVGLADAGKAIETMTGSGANAEEMIALAAEAKQTLGGYYREFLFGGKQTTGWQPTCRCESEGTGRSVVLDPFAGSGTTLRVAERLGRDSIGIELGDYEHLQQERTAVIQREMEIA